MTENRSLDEFVAPADDDGPDAEGDGSDSAVGDDDTGSGPTAGDDEEAAGDEEAVVDPAESTYGWTPGGTPCAACGETVERRWRDDEGLVCGECKDW